MSPLNPKAVIFDMDGLMIDSEPLWWRVERGFVEQYGHVWTDELAASCVGTGLPKVIETVRQQFDLDIDIDHGVACLVDEFIAQRTALTLKRGCLEILDALAAAEWPLAVASSSPRRLIDAVLEQFQLRPRFEVIVSGESVAQPKPAPDIFLRTAELLRCSAEDCVVLEDSLAGVRAALAAGMPVIAVPEADPAPFRELSAYVAPDLLVALTMFAL